MLESSIESAPQDRFSCLRLCWMGFRFASSNTKIQFCKNSENILLSNEAYSSIRLCLPDSFSSTPLQSVTWEQSVRFSWNLPRKKSHSSRLTIRQMASLPIQQGRPWISHVICGYSPGDRLDFSFLQTCCRINSRFMEDYWFNTKTKRKKPAHEPDGTSCPGAPQVEMQVCLR